jgi:glycogen(starch) synthase
MRIGYFVWEFPPRLVGGLGKYAEDMTRIFTRFGHEVSVFTLNTGELKTNENINGIEVHRPKNVNALDILPVVLSEELRKWGNNLQFFNEILSYNFLSASKFVNQKALEKKYDMIAVHDWLSAMAGLIIKRSMKIPMVFHVHSTEIQRSGGEGSRTIRNIEMKIMEKAERVITVSYSMKDHLISIGCPPEKIRVVWNGCDTHIYDQQNVDKAIVEKLKKKYRISPGEKIVLFIGRLTGVKGVENLIMSFPDVLKDYPRTRLVIIGKGEQYEDLIRMADRLGIQEKVTIISDFISEPERLASYYLSDLCVFPSISEPFGIVSLEAMSMKKPLVVGASGINGFKEQVIPSGPDQTGVHVDGRSPTDISWGIKEILRDDNHARQWGENGRKRVENYFTIEKVAEQTLEIYKELFSSRK